jgi:DNA-binding transcriptional ArsR family regulator
MASALPHQPRVDHAPRKQTGITIADDEPADVLQALTSETAQKILRTLGDEPGTASDIADAVDTSLQNVQYHLNRLCETDLVEPVETWYSAKGKEMTVYALTTKRLVIELGGTANSSSE